MCLLIVVSNISIFDWNIGYSAWGIWKLLQNNFHFPQILLNHKADKSVYLNGMTRKSVDECKIDILSEKYFYKIKIIDTMKHLWIQTDVKAMCILLFILKITWCLKSDKFQPQSNSLRVCCLTWMPVPHQQLSLSPFLFPNITNLTK